jgi:hypothetical protein
MRLQQENLLHLVPNKGYFVSHLTIHELNEMYEYRAELEGFCAELAARWWSRLPPVARHSAPQDVNRAKQALVYILPYKSVYLFDRASPCKAPLPALSHIILPRRRGGSSPVRLSEFVSSYFWWGWQNGCLFCA